MRNHLMLLAAVLFLPPVIAQAAGDAVAGAKKAQICAACHGADGNSSNPAWPSLAAQHAEYILKQLQDFKSGKRANVQMTPMAANLGEQDMLDLAAHFSAQKIKPHAADPAMVESGQRVYRAGNSDTGVPACMACHGPAGRGNPAAVYPAVGGQYAVYILAQLKAFRAGQRTNDSNEVMRTITSRMTDDETMAVSEYMQGLHVSGK